MARIRADYVFGTISTTGGITDTATTFDSAELARLPVVTAPDIAAVTIHDATAGTYEIVHVTAHTAAATTATIARGQEGSTAQAWAAGTSWTHGLTVGDVTAISTTSGVQSIVAGTNVTVDDTDPQNPIVSASGGGGGSSAARGLDVVPTSPSAYDDEFDGTTLDAKWAQITSAAGQDATVTLSDSVALITPAASGTASIGKRVVGIRQNSPAGSFSVSAKIVGDALADTRGGLFVASTSANKVHAGGTSASGATLCRALSLTAGSYSETGDWGSSDGFYAETESGYPIQWVWQRIRWDASATTLYFDVSTDGVKWRQYNSRSGQSQPDRFGLAVYAVNADLEADYRLSVDWFRVTTP